MDSFHIGDRLVGLAHPPLVIAEIGINHGGDLSVAIEMAKAAIDSGAEVIKHQTHIPEDEMSSEAKTVIPGNSDKSIYEIIEECALNEDDEFALMNYVKSRGAIFISTPFSRAAVERISRMDLPVIKIGSGECNNYPLVKLVAKLGKPVILSTGMNTIDSIRPSVNILEAHGLPYVLLHCTNLYPTPTDLIRLDAIKELEDSFPRAVLGLSDHSTSNYPALASIALGARVIERHFTDSYDRVGPDINCSMDPAQLKELLEGSRTIFQALGGSKRPAEEEGVTIAFAFASVVTIKAIKAGEKLSMENIWVKRPSGGDFLARDFESLLGSTANTDIPANVQLKTSQVDR
jgi:N-acetylneuraminate synthase